MKQFRILAALILCMIGGSAMAQQYMIVNLEDGRKVEYRLKDVTEVTFREGARKYVDLGLPSGTLWATCNVGANETQEYGDYFAWGMTTPRTDPKQEWIFISEDDRSKLLSQGVIDESNHFTANYDAATANWGTEWRMPTDEEFQELIDNCSWENITIDGINCVKATGSTGESIVFPLGGSFFYDYSPEIGQNGNYWSSNLNLNTQYNFWENSVFWVHNYGEPAGFTSCDKRWTANLVRPVYAKANEPQTPDTPGAKMEWVDLGLPSGLQWAAWSLGATSPEAYGDYYIWGDTEPYNENTPSKSLYGVGESELRNRGIIDSNSTLTPEYDAATVVLGEGCRMPTYYDINELRENTTWAWETLNGVRGMRFTSKHNGNSFFIPAAGVIDGEVVDGVLPKCFDTELVVINTSTASGTCFYDLYIFIPEKDYYGYNDGNFPNYTTLRHQGRIVRAVRMPQ